MGCWQDFGKLVEKYIPDYNDNELAIATLQAAIQLGEDLGGFSDRYTTTLDGTVQQHPSCYARRYVTIAVPIIPGWELTNVNGVSVNGVAIFQQASNPHCISYSVDCNMVDITPPPVGMNATVSIDYSMNIVAGKIGDDMPDFLFEHHNLPMTWKVVALIYTMRKDYQSAGVYEAMYRQSKNKRKARNAGGTAHIDARSALWI